MIKIFKKEVKTITYPNGEFGVKNFEEIVKNIDWNLREYSAGLGAFELPYLSFEWIVEKDWEKELILLLALKNSLESKVKKNIFSSIGIDYLPLTREDKEMSGRIDIAEYILTLISTSFKEVILETIHCYKKIKQEKFSNVKINNTKLFNLVTNTLNDSLQKNVLFIFPDDSAYERLDWSNQRFNLYSYITFEKHRDPQTGEIKSSVINPNKSNYDSEMIYNKVIILDDLCSFGGSFIRALNTIKEKLKIDNKTKATLITYADENQNKPKEFSDNINHIFIKSINFN